MAKDQDEREDEDQEEGEEPEKKAKPEGDGDVEIELEDELAKAKAEEPDEDDDEKAEGRRERRKAKRESLIEEMRAENQRLRETVERALSAGRQPEQQRTPQRDPIAERMAEIEEEAEIIRTAWNSDTLPPERREKLHQRWQSLNREVRSLDAKKAMLEMMPAPERDHVMQAERRNMDEYAIQVERRNLAAKYPEAFKDPALIAACTAEAAKVDADPKYHGMPRYLIGEMIVENVLRRAGKLPGAPAGPSAAAQAKMGAAAGPAKAAPEKKKLKIPKAYVEVAVKDFPKAKNPAEAVRLWAEKLKKAKHPLAKELGL